MSDEKYIQVIQDNQAFIMAHWSDALSAQYPGVFDIEVMLRETEMYFQYILDFTTPVTEHPFVANVPAICEVFLTNDVSVAHIVHSNQLWIDSILGFMEEHPAGQTIPLGLLRKITYRISEYERIVLHHYYSVLKSRLQKNEQMIMELHESRLSIAGKMAASMAHEIRNPLTTIQGFIKLMRGTLEESPAKSSAYLNIIENEFRNIQMQITGFLSFSKRDVTEEAFETISANGLISSVVALATPRLINENIEFCCVEGPDVNLNVQKTSIQQVLSNIINNSVDALSDLETVKRVTITAKQRDTRYIISIANNGPEIPVELRERLFEPFVSSKREGTGLGLAICKQIMEKNSGDVCFTTNPNETVFFLKLPALPASEHSDTEQCLTSN